MEKIHFNEIVLVKHFSTLVKALPSLSGIFFSHDSGEVF